MSAPTKRILDVGQCGVDGPRLRRFLAREFNVTIDQADTKDHALSLAEKNAYDLILVNRILNRDRSPGMDVITALLAAQPGLKVMLISDKPDAQDQAVEAGAIRGFGKARLDSDDTEQLLRAILSESESP
jgi:DNA-binding NarL/FixJ family response regulator